MATLIKDQTGAFKQSTVGQMGTWINPQTGGGYSGPKRSEADIPAPTQVSQTQTLNQNPVVPQKQTVAPSIPIVPTPTPAAQNVQQPAPQQTQDPITKFNMAILDMLKQAQNSSGNQNLYEQQTKLQREQIARTSAETPEELKNLSPEQQSAIRSGSSKSLSPEIDAISAKIKASDSRLQNFETILGQMRDIGMDVAKLNPSKEVIQGYVNMLEAGGDPSSVPNEVIGQVSAKVDWTKWQQSKAAAKNSDSGSNIPKIVKINGVDYQQNADGSIVEPDVPDAVPSAQKVEKAQSVINDIDSILNNKNLSKAIGPKSSAIPEILRSGERNDVDAAIDQLVDSIAIENLGLLKGAMSDKDVEFIRNASTGLKKNMSEEGFKAQLQKLKTKFEEIKTKANQASGSGPSLDDQARIQQMKVDGYSDTEIEQILGKPITFSKAGNASVSIPQGTLAYANNNPGNLRFVGQPGAVLGKSGFAKFQSPEAGLQALESQIQLDASRGHTLATFVNKYAPPSENDTNLYINQIAKSVGASPSTLISKINISSLVKAIAQKESGTKIYA